MGRRGSLARAMRVFDLAREQPFSVGLRLIYLLCCSSVASHLISVNRCISTDLVIVHSPAA